jgi:colanic acid/amylovoran biosynthesis glycosyltransferase
MSTELTAAHCANPFLTRTMVWIYHQIQWLCRYRPVVFTQAVLNRDTFPVETLYSSEDLPLIRRIAFRMIRKIRGTYAGYGDLFRQEGVRVLHAHFGQEGYRCLEVAKETGVPLVTTFYGVDVSALPRQSVWQKRFDRLFKEGQRFLAEGPHMGERLADLGCPPEKIRVHRLGVDTLAIPFQDRREGPQVILMYANFREKKGHIYGVRAFAKIADAFPKSRMRMIGEGPLLGEIEKEIGESGVAERVEFLGALPHKTCIGELAKATILLYPSVTAGDGDTEGGAPVGVIEALASGLPVVSSLHADIPAVAPDGKCALLFPERDVNGLADGLESLLKSPELRAEFAEWGRRHVETEHNIRRQGERLEVLYDEVISEVG